MSATNPFFRVDHQPREGRYDLHLSHANYDRDNGRFECRIKEDGTGVELYTLTVAVTVLLPPGPATITKSRYTRRHYHKSYSTLRSILSESCYYGFQTLRNCTCCLVSPTIYCTPCCSVEAVEGQPYSLTCSSRGGSPAPDLTWTRGLSEVPLRANTTRAADRDAATVSVLEITPSKEDDGVEFRCGVSSRATAATTQAHSLGASINISVNCE